MTPLSVDLLSWWLQAGLLLGAGLALPALFRLRDPGARLRLGQLLLASTLLLPLLQPRPAPTTPDAAGTAAAFSLALLVRPGAPASSPSLDTALLVLLASGVALRLGWLGAGLARLSAIRRGSRALAPLPPAVVAALARTGANAELLVSREVASPVTIGWRRPAVILPEGFEALDVPEQEAVACHELLHVKRRDSWSLLLEEAARALLWPQPAAWGVLSDISLAREQAVDRAVVASTGDRRSYLRALADLARLSQDSPAAALPFQTRSHLLRRVAHLAKEVPMSRRSVHLATAAAAASLLLVGAAGASAFPFGGAPPKAAAKAAPAKPGPDDGIYKIGGDVKEPVELNRVQPVYPEEARKNRIQGVVIVEAILDETGRVKKAEVNMTDGAPDESLVTAALEAVKQWTYKPATKNGKPVKVRMTITVAFKLE